MRMCVGGGYVRACVRVRVCVCGTLPFCNSGPVTPHVSHTAVQPSDKRLRYSQVFNDNARNIAFTLKHLHLTLLSAPEFGS